MDDKKKYNLRSLREAAILLHIPKRELEAAVEAGSVPYTLVGKQAMFNMDDKRSAIDPSRTFERRGQR